MKNGTNQDQLTEFLYWFLSRRISLLSSSPPSGSGLIFDHEFVLTATLFRANQFQVELVIVKPSTPIWPGEHRHPHVDTYEVIMANGVPFTRNGEIVTKPDLIISGCSCIRLRPTDFHGGGAGPFGITFMSVQQWLEIQPTSVGMDWIGEPTTAGHRKQLEEYA